jgi:hypothetical protein
LADSIDRNGEFDSADDRFRAPIPNGGSWSTAGVAVIKFSAILLTVKLRVAMSALE